MIKILAIGNSFSQDATTYLYNIAKADNIDLKVVNLYIGGCSLETHCRNLENDSAFYDYELNGQSTGKKISILEALKEEAWDYVTLQQVSNDSGIINSYYPYIIKLSNYIKQYAPQSEQLLHQTWAYEIDSTHSAFSNYKNNQELMYQAIVETYQKVGNDLSVKIIPCGEVIQILRTRPEFDYGNGGLSLCRDGFHMSLVYGRYAVAATWYEFILRRRILDNSFVPPAIDGLTAGATEIKLIKAAVDQILSCKLDCDANSNK
ncbi:MAG: hypothetical protein K0S01_217 [Herbinix sp.]|jgi:hypothetical protein|nr:hypothetical protein [Herbinix sp.]